MTRKDGCIRDLFISKHDPLGAAGCSWRLQNISHVNKFRDTKFTTETKVLDFQDKLSQGFHITSCRFSELKM